MSGLDQSQHNDADINDTDKENIDHTDTGGGGTFTKSQTSEDQKGGQSVPLVADILLGVIVVVIVGVFLYTNFPKK